MSSPIRFFAAAAGIALGAHSLAIAADDPPDPPKGVEVLARGPIHEGFAQPAEQQPKPGPVVPKQPPDPIDELPPEQKPEGDNVVWLPGYWQWDIDRKDYIWVSGFWRAAPPERVWVPGSWRKSDDGWQWVGGLWAPAKQEKTEVQYLPEPPAPLEVGPTTLAPNDSSIYVPGSWVYRERYVWRPGYWIDHRPDWMWISAHYRWTPAGCVFIDGYWDYPLAGRGVLYAPAYIDPAVYAAPNYCYTPSYVINEPCLYGSLWVRRGWGSYYFGDYFGPAYATAGFVSWSGLYGGPNVGVMRGWCDPMFSYYRACFPRDPFWRGGINDLYVGRFRGDIPSPPRTLGMQNQFFANAPITGNRAMVNNRPVNVGDMRMLGTPGQLARTSPNLRFQNLGMDARRDVMQSGRTINNFARQRGQLEGQLGSRNPGGQPRLTDGPRSLQLNVPNPLTARGSAPSLPGNVGGARPQGSPGGSPALVTPRNGGGPAQGLPQLGGSNNIPSLRGGQQGMGGLGSRQTPRLGLDRPNIPNNSPRIGLGSQAPSTGAGSPRLTPGGASGSPSPPRIENRQPLSSMPSQPRLGQSGSPSAQGRQRMELPTVRGQQPQLGGSPTPRLNMPSSPSMRNQPQQARPAAPSMSQPRVQSRPALQARPQPSAAAQPRSVPSFNRPTAVQQPRSQPNFSRPAAPRQNVRPAAMPSINRAQAPSGGRPSAPARPGGGGNIRRR